MNTRPPCTVYADHSLHAVWRSALLWRCQRNLEVFLVFQGSAISRLTVTCIYQLTAQAGTRVFKDAIWNFMISDVVSCIL